MRRSYIQHSLAQLRALFEARGYEQAILQGLRIELSHRDSRGANQLNIEVLQRIQELESATDDPEIKEPEDRPDNQYAAQSIAHSHAASSGDSTHPDDQKRPATLTRIRPPGTSGLPNAWQRQLEQDLSLRVAPNAELPELFVAAINALVAEIKRSGANQKRYDLEKGERLETAQDDILYAFPFSDEAELFEEAQIELHALGRRVEGSIVSISAGRLVLALRDDLGADIAKATLVIDTTALLVALATKIELVRNGGVSLNRDLADCVAGRNDRPNKPGPIAAKPPKDLNQAQQRAFATAGSAPVTWIWGPPGCGKTKTLGEIVRTAFENGRRLLVCSNTNKAVDQVIYSICEVLGTEHPAMQEGKVVRLGRIADNKLETYKAYVTIDGIVERRSRELQERRGQIERALELIDNRTFKHQRLLARFQELDKAVEELAVVTQALAKAASAAEAVERSHQRNAQRTIELNAELLKRQTAFFTLLSRKEEDIQHELATADAERVQIENKWAAVKQGHETAQRVFDLASNDYAAKRDALSGEDRKLVEQAIRDAADERSDLVSELREVEAKIAAIRETIVKEARVLGVTCTKAYLAVKEIGQVDTVIIDEASMVLLPVAWFAAGLAKERVIVCGDFRQIPPIVQSNQQCIVDAIGKDAFTANGIRDGDARLVMRLLTDAMTLSPPLPHSINP